jgi:SEC-C motif domain protein
MTENCYCSSGKNFADCCEPFLLGNAKPLTAEQLMRSRYSAYATADFDYVLKTTHPKTRKFISVDSIKHRANSNSWEKLEIISTVNGTQKDSRGTVEFKAYYSDSSLQTHIHHESSDFVKELGKWFFSDGKVTM